MKIELDKENIIIGLGASWNDSLLVPSPSLHGSAILGKSLFTFIQGDVTKMAVDSAIMHARACKRSVKKQYRCDSASVNRFFEMEINPIDNFGVSIEHALLRTQQKPLASVISECADTAQCLPDTITRCSFCCSFLREGSWLEAEEYRAITGKSVSRLFSDSVEYMVCESCWKDYTHHDF